MVDLAERSLKFRQDMRSAMAFDLHQLRAFNAIVATGSLGRAAEVLNVTQPALSRTIRRLEEAAGAALFERHSKGMQLTHIGYALVPYAKTLTEGANNAAEEIKVLLGMAKGTVRVGAVGSIASALLPLAIERTSKAWPHLRFQVLEDTWQRVANALVSRDIDLALGLETADSTEFVAMKEMRWRISSHVIASMQHPLRKNRKLTLADTVNERWTVLPRGTIPFERMRSLFARHQLPLPNVVVETRSDMVMRRLIAHSGFLGWSPEPLFETERKAGLVDRLPIADASDSLAFTAFRRRSGTLPSPVLKLLEELRELSVQ
jgi:DNA-binding transcriptional LysR family regulator